MLFFVFLNCCGLEIVLILSVCPVEVGCGRSLKVPRVSAITASSRQHILTLQVRHFKFYSFECTDLPTAETSFSLLDF